MNTPTPNAQTPGPFRFAPNGGHLNRARLLGPPHPVDGGDFAALASLTNPATARLLASAYTMADKAGRTLGVDAAELCERIDLAELVGALEGLAREAANCNARQHAGLVVLSRDWADLYDATNRARAILARVKAP